MANPKFEDTVPAFEDTTPIEDQEQDEPGFIEKVGKHLDKRGEAVEETFSTMSDRVSDSDLLTLTPRVMGAAQEGGLQVAGQTAGFVTDVIGEGVSSAASGIASILPEGLKDSTKQMYHKVIGMINRTEVGQYAKEAIIGGSDQWSEFKDANPEFAKDIESAFNIGLLLAPVKVKRNAAPSILGKAGEKLEAVAVKQVKMKRENFLRKLVSPKETKKVLEEQTQRITEKGILRKGVVEPTKRELAMAVEVGKINTVKPTQSIQRNLQEVIKANDQLAIKLEKIVEKKRVFIPDIESQLDEAVNKLISSNPLIVGDASSTAKKMLAQAKNIVSKHPPTAAGLLRARKELDALALTQRGKKAFGAEQGALENAFTESLRSIRQAMNNGIDKAVTNISVKQELKRQSTLFSAIETMVPKAAVEWNTSIGRAVQNMAKVLPVRSEFIQQAGALTGLGLVGASATFAPVFTQLLAGGAVTVLGGKLIMSAGAKKQVAKLIKGVDAAILSSKNPSMIKQLRADRVIIADLLKSSVEEPPQQQQEQEQQQQLQ